MHVVCVRSTSKELLPFPSNTYDLLLLMHMVESVRTQYNLYILLL
jgi:hypothetical protein